VDEHQLAVFLRDVAPVMEQALGFIGDCLSDAGFRGLGAKLLGCQGGNRRLGPCRHNENVFEY